MHTCQDGLAALDLASNFKNKNYWKREKVEKKWQKRRGEGEKGSLPPSSRRVHRGGYLRKREVGTVIPTMV